MRAVVHSFGYCLDYLRDQVKDVADVDMVAQPNGIVNHPAWVIGHLTHACQLLGGAIGLSPWLPRDWESVTAQAACPLLMPPDTDQKRVLSKRLAPPSLESSQPSQN